MLDLNPTGTVNLSGSVDVYGTANADAPLRKIWNLSLDVNQGGLDVGPRLENINGTIRLFGESPAKDGQEVGCHGTLAIDSLTFKDIQVTHLQGPIWVDSKRVLFGAITPPQSGQPPRRVTGEIYGGTVQADGSVEQSDAAHGNEPLYSFVFGIGLPDNTGMPTSGADLKRIALDNGFGKKRLDGTVRGSIKLANWYRLRSGEIVCTGHGVHGIRGDGQMHLTNADIYELPLMVSLLKILSIKRPDATAFTTSDIFYHIEGDHVYLDKIAFIGDAISLDGAGEMGFDTHDQTHVPRDRRSQRLANPDCAKT